MTPLVSVVIPVHNRASDLRNALNSILTQGLDVEIIFVDDASTDQSPATIRELASLHSSVRFELLSNNRGGGFARNVGIDMAAGKWVAFLDSDDLWLPNKLATQIDALEKASNAESLCFTNLVVDHHDGNEPLPWNVGAFESKNSVSHYLLHRHQVIQTSTIVMSATAAKRVRFNDNLRRHQDIDFVLRCAADGLAFTYIDQSLVRYSADPKASRVSKRVNATPSLQWLQVAQSYLTDADIDAFYLRHVFDMHFNDSPNAAIARSWQITRAGRQSAGSFIKGVARQMAPESLKRFVQALRRK